MSGMMSFCRRMVWRRGLATLQSTTPTVLQQQRKIRNVGIIAHIDSGKTTTTERMLFYAGQTRAIGEVDDGTTVTDFMVQERERGITIQAAAVTFPWRNHRINLIDTPGHVDFTVEVERAVRVMDGMVAILDGVSGVEAQTKTVWLQASKYAVPRVVYINKMDREGADLFRSVETLHKKLQAQCLIVQLPMGEASLFKGIIDLVSMEELTWNDKEGRDLTRTPLIETSKYFEEATAARAKLIDEVADLDDLLTETILEKESSDAIDATALRDAIARVTKSGKAFPVLCGSSFKNRGVQPVLDAIVDYLPCPLERPPVRAHRLPASSSVKSASSPRTSTENNNIVDSRRFSVIAPAKAPHGAEMVQIGADPSKDLCVLAYKVTHHPRRGLLVHFRVYQGTMEGRQTLLNVTRGGVKERPSRLLQLFGGDYEEVNEITAGNIGVAVGLKETFTGDTLTTALPRSSLENVILEGIESPAPVFFCTLEAESAADQVALDNAVSCLLREDPSLQARFDSDTGETVISGMGELHLDIMRDRVNREFQVPAKIGGVQVSYRETPTIECRKTVNFERVLSGRLQSVRCTVLVRPREDAQTVNVEFALPPAEANSAGEGAKLTPHILDAAKQAATSACSHGLLSGYPISATELIIEELVMSSESSVAGVQACVVETVMQAIRGCELALLEPFMNVEIMCEEGDVGTILSDLTTARCANIQSVLSENLKTHKVVAEVPLSKMVGYSTDLRTATGGRASFSMEFCKYALSPSSAS